jgi:hypothetical protein
MEVCRECSVLSSIGLWDEPNIRPEESYRLWFVFVCGLENTPLVNEEEGQGPVGGYRAKRKIKLLGYIKIGASNKREFCSTFYKEFQCSKVIQSRQPLLQPSAKPYTRH